MKNIKSWIAKTSAEKIHKLVLSFNDNEPLDGDEVDELVEKIRKELNILNANS